MAGGVSKLEGWWKLLQLLLITASGALLFWLIDIDYILLSKWKQIYIYAVDGVTYVIVLIQLIGIILKKPAPKLVVILLAIKGASIWAYAAALELLSYHINFAELIADEKNDVIKQATGMTDDLHKYMLLSLGIITTVNAFSFLVEACRVSSWRNSAAATQRGFVFQTV